MNQLAQFTAPANNDPLLMLNRLATSKRPVIVGTAHVGGAVGLGSIQPVHGRDDANERVGVDRDTRVGLVVDGRVEVPISRRFRS